jgi:hypothetical protein
MAAGLEALATFLLWYDKINSDNWEVVTMAIAGSYLFSQAYVDKNK